jgi:GPH family glycoside/pentoside/hexuronide:cation symporter
MAEESSPVGSGAPTAKTQVVPSSAVLTGYGIGSVGMGVWVTVPGLLLLYYLTNILGVSPALAGVAL